MKARAHLPLNLALVQMIALPMPTNTELLSYLRGARHEQKLSRVYAAKRVDSTRRGDKSALPARVLRVGSGEGLVRQCRKVFRKIRFLTLDEV